ncbi:MAG TPA: metal-dependent hydrolase [Polyangia bacterium]
MQTSESIPVRNVRFSLGDVPRFWHGGNAAITSFFNNLSTFFPPGERFFVASVNRFKERVDDEALRRQIASFCGQEGFHSREHVRYNRMLTAQGYPADALEARTERILRLVTRALAPSARLAATCALEHFTATLAHVLLSDPELLADAHPAMAALWKWHAAEENEHKAVAFDVYARTGGRWSERVVVMLLATIIFWALVVEQQLRLMHADGILFSVRQWASLSRFLWTRPGALRKMWRLYVDYFRPGFHPWQLDNRALLDAWKAEYDSAPAYQLIS